MIEVLLTTLETEMSTTAVDQDLAKKIANIISKVHRILNLPENIAEIDIEVAYQFIKHLENNKMFRKELMACERCKWAGYLMLLTHSEGSPECFKRILGEFNVSLTEPLLKILEI